MFSDVFAQSAERLYLVNKKAGNLPAFEYVLIQ